MLSKRPPFSPPKPEALPLTLTGVNFQSSLLKQRTLKDYEHHLQVTNVPSYSLNPPPILELLLDTSPSMSFKSHESLHTKQEIAEALAQALLHTATKSKHRVKIEDLTKLAGTREPTHPPSLGRALQRYLNFLTPSNFPTRVSAPNLTILFTDLFDSDQTLLYKALQELRLVVSYLVVIQVVDPMEIFFNYQQPVTFKDLGDPQAPGFFSDPYTLRQAFRKEMQKFLKATRTRLTHLGSEYHLFLTNAEQKPFLSQLLRSS